MTSQPRRRVGISQQGVDRGDRVLLSPGPPAGGRPDRADPVTQGVHRRQLRVIAVTGAGRPAAPFVKARGRDLQDPAGHRDREPVGGKLLDQPEPYFGRMFSRAK